LGERYADLYALALARLANAMVLTGDLVGADEVFQRVEKDCARPRAGRDKGIQGEILFLKGTLRLFQRRFSEARELLGTAIEVAETISDVGLHINARLQRAAAAGYEGRPNAMIPDLRAVAGLLRNQQNPDRLQMLCLYQDLTWAYLENGDIERAKAELPRAKALCEELGHTASGHQLQWIEGLSAKAQGELRDAERLFRQARDGFNESGDVYSLAIASLEIAILCQAQGRDGEVITLVTGEVLPVLESLA
ncbi:MAG: hypothetical protein GY856_52035, partial [bacterium]|nr:hypothetical protein [bacterium]